MARNSSPLPRNTVAKNRSRESAEPVTQHSDERQERDPASGSSNQGRGDLGAVAGSRGLRGPGRGAVTGHVPDRGSAGNAVTFSAGSLLHKVTETRGFPDPHTSRYPLFDNPYKVLTCGYEGSPAEPPRRQVPPPVQATEHPPDPKSVTPRRRRCRPSSRRSWSAAVTGRIIDLAVRRWWGGGKLEFVRAGVLDAAVGEIHGQ